VQPLSETLGLAIHEDEGLTSERSRQELRDTFQGLPANSVACTHGEVIQKLFAGSITCAKGAFWILDRLETGKLIPARYVDVP
jgi:hypothetical protein